MFISYIIKYISYILINVYHVYQWWRTRHISPLGRHGQVLRREVEGLSQNVYHQLQDAGVKARDCHGCHGLRYWWDSSPVLVYVLFMLKNDRISMVNPWNQKLSVSSTWNILKYYIIYILYNYIYILLQGFREILIEFVECHSQSMLVHGLLRGKCPEVTVPISAEKTCHSSKNTKRSPSSVAEELLHAAPAVADGPWLRPIL